MAELNRNWLVDTAWLGERLEAPDLAVLDATWYLPAEGKDGHVEFLKEHIPGAQFFDINEIADTDVGLPHMLPSPAKFSSRMRKMGIGDGMRIVVYDQKGLFSAARVWWMFRVMGKEDVAVLDGGLPKWRSEDRPLEDGPPRLRSERHFTVRRNAALVRDKADVVAILGSPATQLVDARPAGRFEGKDPEPRSAARLGHIPGARNVPFTALLNPDGTLKSEADLLAVLAGAGVDPQKPVVASCGSGVTASVVALALATLGQPQTAVYDGSWAEWGNDAEVPIETGPAK